MEGVSIGDGGDTQNLSMETRKRVRSGDSGSEGSEDLPDASPVAKKMSVCLSGEDENSVRINKLDRIALLDAGAQYGKVCGGEECSRA